MKTIHYMFLLLCCACTQSIDLEKEKEAIKAFLENETQYAAAADTSNWNKCWVHDDAATFTFAGSDANNFYHLQGWTNVKKLTDNFTPFELKLSRSNYSFSIDKNFAYVTFDQEDNWNDQKNHKKESRTLVKVDGQWKIQHMQVIDASSYEGDVYRRVLLMKFKPTTTAGELMKIRETFYGLKEKIPGFINFIWIENKLQEKDDHFTHTLILDFESVEAESVYANHEDHQWLMNEGGKVLDNISHIDYWVKK